MAKAGRAWVRHVRRLAFAAGLLAAVYVGSYAVLYRRGVREAERYGFDYFFYVPVADVAAARDTTRQHQVLGPVYAPLNHLHDRWLGGRAACRCVLFGLGRDPALGAAPDAEPGAAADTAAR